MLKLRGEMMGTDLGTYAPRTFVIADIHGCYSTLRGLLGQIALTHQDILYLLGDYIDRGSDSKEVIRYLLHLQSEGYLIKPVMGNHEFLLLTALQTGRQEDLQEWLLNGGKTTLASYGVAHPADIQPDHIDFMASMPVFRETDSHIFVHAALDLTLEDPLVVEGYEAMLWDRRCTGDLSRIGSKKVIAGHTPKLLDAIQAGLQGQFIQIDNGCYLGTRTRGKGNLVALELGSGKLFHYPNRSLMRKN